MAERLAHILVDPPVRQAEGAAVGRQQVHEEAVFGHLPLRLGWEGRHRCQSEPSVGQPPPGVPGRHCFWRKSPQALCFLVLSLSYYLSEGGKFESLHQTVITPEWSPVPSFSVSHTVRPLRTGPHLLYPSRREPPLKQGPILSQSWVQEEHKKEAGKTSAFPASSLFPGGGVLKTP